jgi:hypothetical protein
LRHALNPAPQSKPKSLLYRKRKPQLKYRKLRIVLVGLPCVYVLALNVHSCCLCLECGDLPMARWVLSCKSCREVFVHSAIPDTMPNYYLSAEGDERECPNARFVYQRIDLRYQIDPIRHGRTAR